MSNQPDFKLTDYPFSTAGFSGVSQKNNKPYQRVSIQKGEKDQDGKWDNKGFSCFLNEIPKLTLLLTATYLEGMKQERDSAPKSYNQAQDNINAPVDSDSDIPF